MFYCGCSLSTTLTSHIIHLLKVKHWVQCLKWEKMTVKSKSDPIALVIVVFALTMRTYDTTHTQKRWPCPTDLFESAMVGHHLNNVPWFNCHIMRLGPLLVSGPLGMWLKISDTHEWRLVTDKMNPYGFQRNVGGELDFIRDFIRCDEIRRSDLKDSFVWYYWWGKMVWIFTAHASTCVFLKCPLQKATSQIDSDKGIKILYYKYILIKPFTKREFPLLSKTYLIVAKEF